MLSTIAILAAIVGVLLIVIVLIQNPKGGGVDSTFGGNSANQMFGAARSTDIVEKISWGLGAGLFTLCILATFFLKSAAAL
jgi:preprotein translocase subunit SecG